MLHRWMEDGEPGRKRVLPSSEPANWLLFDFKNYISDDP